MILKQILTGMEFNIDNISKSDLGKSLELLKKSPKVSVIIPIFNSFY